MPSPKSTAEISKPIVVPFMAAPRALLLRGRRLMKMASPAGRPMNITAVVSSLWAYTMRRETLQRNRNRTKAASPHWPSEMGGLGGFGGSSGGLGCQFAGNGLLGWVLIGGSSKDGVECRREFQQGIGNGWQAITHRKIGERGLHPSEQFACRATARRAVVHAEIQKREMDDVKEFRQGGRGCCVGRVSGVAD